MNSIGYVYRDADPGCAQQLSTPSLPVGLVLTCEPGPRWERTRWLSSSVYRLYDGSGEVGQFIFIRETRFVGSVEVRADARQRGLGKLLYRLVAEHAGGVLQRDPHCSVDARRVHEALLRSPEWRMIDDAWLVLLPRSDRNWGEAVPVSAKACEFHATA